MAICVCPNADIKSNSREIVISRQAFDLSGILGAADLAITNGGAGLLTRCMTMGIPMLLALRFPNNNSVLVVS